MPTRVSSGIVQTLVLGSSRFWGQIWGHLRFPTRHVPPRWPSRIRKSPAPKPDPSRTAFSTGTSPMSRYSPAARNIGAFSIAMPAKRSVSLWAWTARSPHHIGPTQLVDDLLSRIALFWHVPEPLVPSCGTSPVPSLISEATRSPGSFVPRGHPPSPELWRYVRVKPEHIVRIVLGL